MHMLYALYLGPYISDLLLILQMILPVYSPLLYFWTHQRLLIWYLTIFFSLSSLISPCPTVNNWFYSYLSGLQQSVVYQDQLSSHLPVSLRVLQVSILGPLLFSLFINYLHTSTKHGTLIQYADDSTPIFSAPLYQNSKILPKSHSHL